MNTQYIPPCGTAQKQLSASVPSEVLAEVNSSLRMLAYVLWAALIAALTVLVLILWPAQLTAWFHRTDGLPLFPYLLGALVLVVGFKTYRVIKHGGE